MSARHFTNEHADVVARRAGELGFVADHCSESVAREVSLAGELFEEVTTAAFEGKASLEVAGIRVMEMATRCGRLCSWRGIPKRVREGALRAPSVAVFAPGAHAADAMGVFDLLIDRERTAARIGRRVSLIAYALNPNVVVLKSLPNLGGIGKLWELAAENKRSAVCEAMNVLRADLVRWARLEPGFRFWFEKRAEARASYAAAARGNTNRKGGMAHDDEPLPVREDTIMKTKEGRKRADRLWEEAERKRLERLVIPRG